MYEIRTFSIVLNTVAHCRASRSRSSPFHAASKIEIRKVALIGVYLYEGIHISLKVYINKTKVSFRTQHFPLNSAA